MGELHEERAIDWSVEAWNEVRMEAVNLHAMRRPATATAQDLALARQGRRSCKSGRRSPWRTAGGELAEPSSMVGKAAEEEENAAQGLTTMRLAALTWAAVAQIAMLASPRRSSAALNPLESWIPVLLAWPRQMVMGYATLTRGPTARASTKVMEGLSAPRTCGRSASEELRTPSNAGGCAGSSPWAMGST